MESKQENSSRITRQPLPQGRITRTQSDNVSYGSHEKDYYEIQSVDISSYRIHKDDHGKTYAAYLIVVMMKSGVLTFAIWLMLLIAVLIFVNRKDLDS
jgi:hypothetical protein